MKTRLLIGIVCLSVLSSCSEPDIGRVENYTLSIDDIPQEMLTAARVKIASFETGVSIFDTESAFKKMGFSTEIHAGYPYNRGNGEVYTIAGLNGNTVNVFRVAHGGVFKQLSVKKEILNPIENKKFLIGTGNYRIMEGKNPGYDVTLFEGGAEYIGDKLVKVYYNESYSDKLSIGPNYDKRISEIESDLGVILPIFTATFSKDFPTLHRGKMNLLDSNGKVVEGNAEIDTSRCQDPLTAGRITSIGNKNQTYNVNICSLEFQYSNYAQKSYFVSEFTLEKYVSYFGKPDCWWFDEKCISDEVKEKINKIIEGTN